MVCKLVKERHAPTSTGDLASHGFYMLRCVIPQATVVKHHSRDTRTGHKSYNLSFCLFFPLIHVRNFHDPLLKKNTALRLPKKACRGSLLSKGKVRKLTLVCRHDTVSIN